MRMHECSTRVHAGCGHRNWKDLLWYSFDILTTVAATIVVVLLAIANRFLRSSYGRLGASHCSGTRNLTDALAACGY
jgi:hypothetical protein